MSLVETKSEQAVDPELDAMTQVLAALRALEPEARARVVDWVVDRLDIAARRSKPQTGQPTDKRDEEQGDDSPPPAAPTASATAFEHLGELFAAAKPATQVEMALVGGYWLQVIQGNADLSAQAINTELKHLGHGVSNITAALDALKEEKPQLVIQLRKNGTSQQARKKYKLTGAGIDRVKAILLERA